MTAGLSPFGFGPFSDEIAQRLRMGQTLGVATGFPQAPQIAWPPQAQVDDVPEAASPGYSGFVAPSAPTMQAQATPVGGATPADAAMQPVAAPPSMVGAQMPVFGFGGTPVTQSEFDERFGAAPPGESRGITAAQADALRAGLLRSGGGSPAPVAVQARRGQAPAVSVPETPKADMPAENAVPAQGQMPTPVAAQPATSADTGFDLSAGLKRFRDAGGFETLGNIGIGLMSTHGFGQGVANGLKLDQDAQAKRAVTDLARAKFGIEQAKTARDIAGQNQTKAWLLSRGLDPAAADAAIANPSVLSATVAQMNKDPSVVEIAGKKYSLKPGEKPSEANLLGDAKEDNSVKLLSTPEDRAAAGIQPNDTRTARIDSKGKVTFDPAPAAPAVHILEDENGNKHIRQWDPKTNSWVDPAQPPGAPPKPTNPLALPGKTTGDQSKAAGFADRMLNSERILAEKQKEGTDLAQRGYDSVPLVGNYLTSDGYQAYSQARRDFANAQLRRESGAAIGKDEFASADKQYFPQPGDSAETIKQKAKNRRIAVEAMIREAGTTYLPTHIYDDDGAIVPYAPGARKSVPHQPAPNEQAAPAASAMPKSKAEYDALPSGAMYLAPDGTMRKKP